MGPDRRTQNQGGDRLSNTPADLAALARAALAREPDRRAIEFAARWHTWGELAGVANSLWRVLAEVPGGAGAPVVFVPRNHPDSIAALLALLAERRTVRMVYAFQSAEGIARDLCAREGCAIIAHAEDLTKAVRDAAARMRMTVIALHDGAAEMIVTACPTRPLTAPAEPEIEILTSGTTGPPKRFSVSYDLLQRHFIQTSFAPGADGESHTLPPFLLSFPLGNITGLYTTLPTVLRGQPIVLLERFRLRAWLDYVKLYRPAHSGLPPSCVRELLDADVPREELASLEALGVGAAPLDPTTQAEFEDRYGIPILVSYGATEFAGPVTAVSPADHAAFGRSKLGTVGRALPGARLRVIDPDSGAELPTGATGLLEVISPRIGPGWIRTTDLAAIDADGFVFIRGRADGAINRGGFKILPESLEAALTLHPAVSEAAVVGIIDRRLGEVPAAAVRLAPGSLAITSEALNAHLRMHVPAPNIPVKYMFFDDFPRTPSHKIDRVELRCLLGNPAAETA